MKIYLELFVIILRDHQSCRKPNELTSSTRRWRHWFHFHMNSYLCDPFCPTNFHNIDEKKQHIIVETILSHFNVNTLVKELDTFEKKMTMTYLTRFKTSLFLEYFCWKKKQNKYDWHTPLLFGRTRCSISCRCSWSFCVESLNHKVSESLRDKFSQRFPFCVRRLSWVSQSLKRLLEKGSTSTRDAI